MKSTKRDLYMFVILFVFLIAASSVVMFAVSKYEMENEIKVENYRAVVEQDTYDGYIGEE